MHQSVKNFCVLESRLILVIHLPLLSLKGQADHRTCSIEDFFRMFSVFTAWRHPIMCKITGRRQYSKDLAHGGLEIPCILTFVGCFTTVEKLIKKSLAIPTQQVEIPANMKRPLENSSKDKPSRKKACTCVNQYVDTEAIPNGKELINSHVGFAQALLKQLFPHLNGLQPTVLQAKQTLGVQKPLPSQLQVIHSRGDHWILASNISCTNGDVNVYYDSVYSSVDKATIAIITRLFQSSAIKMVKSPKQKSGTVVFSP